MRRTTKKDLLAKCSPTWADVSYEALLFRIQIPPYWRLQPKQATKETFKRIARSQEQGAEEGIWWYSVLYVSLRMASIISVNFEKKLCSFATIVCPVWWGCECVREDRVRREGRFRQCGCMCVCREGSSGEGGPVLFDHARRHGHLRLSIECRIVRQHCEHPIQIKRSVYLSAIFILLLTVQIQYRSAPLKLSELHCRPQPCGLKSVCLTCCRITNPLSPQMSRHEK